MRRHVFISLLIALLLPDRGMSAADVSAGELAQKLSAKQSGTAYVRVRMTTGGGVPLQLQIKSRAARGNAEIIYQVLFPKERKGEAVLLRQSGGRMSGTHFVPPDSMRSLNAAQFDQPLFGSALSYEDVVDNFFAWDQQTIVGTEIIDRVECQILESKPGRNRQSSYASVRTWVDPQRMVPLRIEKYGAGGKLIRRIGTTRILLDGDDSIPANLSVRGPGGVVTEIDGSRIKRGTSFADAEFTPDALSNLSAPRGSSEP